MNEEQAVGNVFGPFHEMGVRILGYLPNLTAGLLVLLLGLVICWIVRKATVRLVLLFRLDRAFKEFSWAKGLERADSRHVVAGILGNVVAILLFFVFLQNAIVLWRLQILADLVGRFVFYLPQLVVGLLVLTVGSIVAAVASHRVRTGLAVEGFARAMLVGRLTRWGLMLVASALALEELGIAPHTVQAAVKIGLGSIGLTTAVAVGLGSREAVTRMWQSVLDKHPNA